LAKFYTSCLNLFYSLAGKLPLAQLAHLRKWLLRLLKAGISLAACYYIWQRLSADARFWYDWQHYLSLQHAGLLLLSVLLIAANWGLEAAKWYYMLQPLHRELKFGTAFKAVITGIATGMFTPNRIGEYVGRMYMLPANMRTAAVTYTFINRIHQMLITLCAGALAVEYMWACHPALFGQFVPPGSVLWLRLALWAGCILGAGMALRPQWFSWLLQLLPAYAWVQRARQAIEELHGRRLGLAVGLSALRYGVFATQYVLLMYVFGYGQGVAAALAMTALIFLVKSLIPFLAVAELGVRESLAIIVMGALSVTAATAFCSTFVLYLFNVILPALLGLVYVLRLK